MTFEKTSNTFRMALGATALTLIGGAAYADQVINDDLIVTFSACIGNDCVNGESFGFDTLRLKENNLRINFADTSNSASFPTADWRIVANDTSNGGASYLAFEDTNAGRQTFRVMQGAPANSMVLDAQGDLGLGIASAVVELHIVDGDSPTIRLEQNGSSGFTPQTFDIAANEANFFVRDVTNGSQLPLQIKPGADTASLFIAADNDVGLGTASPDADLHVIASGGVLIENADGAAATDFQLDVLDNQPLLLKLANSTGGVTLRLDPDDNDTFWNVTAATGGGALNFARNGNATGTEMILAENGDLTIAGILTVTGGTTVPDYVFADDYELMPLSEVEAFITANSHLPKIPSAAEVGKNGLNMTQMQMALLEKVEELTLHTIAQQKTIDALQDRLETLAN